MSVDLTYHASQFPRAVHAGLVGSLEAGRVPGRFLYDSPAQAARWLAYHRAFSPSRTSTEVHDLYDRAFASAWAHGEGRNTTCVGVGCGGGAKDGQLLAAAPSSAVPTYVAADTSPALVLAAADAVQTARADTPARRVVLDLTARPERAVYLGDAAPQRVIWSALGLIPNLDAEWLLPYLAGLLAPQDCLLLSVNTSPGPHLESRDRIRPQYDNPEAHAWYRGALEELGLSSEDAGLVMSDRALRPDGAIWRIEAHAEVRRDCAVHVFADRIALTAGTRLEVFHSDRYLPEALPEVFSQYGLTVVDGWLANNREEAVFLLASAA